MMNSTRRYCPQTRFHHGGYCECDSAVAHTAGYLIHTTTTATPVRVTSVGRARGYRDRGLGNADESGGSDWPIEKKKRRRRRRRRRRRNPCALVVVVALLPEPSSVRARVAGRTYRHERTRQPPPKDPPRTGKTDTSVLLYFVLFECFSFF